MCQRRCQPLKGTCFVIYYKKAMTATATKKEVIKLEPLEDRVLVEPEPPEEVTQSGIIIPDTAKEKPQRGRVVAVGPGKKDTPMTVKVGDRVLYGKYAGTEITIDGKEYLIMRQSDIYAIIKE